MAIQRYQNFQVNIQTPDAFSVLSESHILKQGETAGFLTHSHRHCFPSVHTGLLTEYKYERQMEGFGDFLHFHKDTQQ